MSVRPPPLMTVAFSGAGMSPPIFSILLPTTRTDVLAVSLFDLPSNTITFLNRVALGCFASTLAGGRAAAAGCGGPPDASAGFLPWARVWLNRPDAASQASRAPTASRAAAGRSVCVRMVSSPFVAAKGGNVLAAILSRERTDGLAPAVSGQGRRPGLVGRPPRPPPPRLAGQPAGDLVEPVAHGVLPAEGRRPPAHDEEGRLKSVLGVLLVTQHPPAHCQDPRPVPPDGGGARTLVPEAPAAPEH